MTRGSYREVLLLDVGSTIEQSSSVPRALPSVSRHPRLSHAVSMKLDSSALKFL